MHKQLIVALFILTAGGCAATVAPQPRTAETVAVYLTDYGIHSSLLMPSGEHRYVEYAFGDWNFAAKNHCWPQDAFSAC